MLANLMLWGWPVIGLTLFGSLEFRKALVITIIAGYLLMPSHFSYDFPLIPRLDKDVMAGLAAVLGCLVFADNMDASRSLPGWLPRSPTIQVLLALLVVGSFVTAMTNGERLVYGGGIRVQPPYELYDAFTKLIDFAMVALPFFLARKYLAHPDSHRIMIMVIIAAALIYTVPTLWEVRMSPQIHKTIYGFHGGQWRQNLRADGFRPYVFLNHGLPLGVFFMMSVIAAFGASRLVAPERRRRLLMVALWLFIVLILSKNLGSLIIASTLGAAILFLRARAQILIAALISLIFMSYPLLRHNNLIPTDKMVGWASMVSEDRAGSLRFRFMNEDILLDRAMEKPLAGWGAWGRNRVIDERGRDVSVTDGGWVINLGEGGWLRYIGLFGMFTAPVLLMAWRRYELEPATITLVMISMGNLVNLLPNSDISPVTWLVLGSVVGRLEFARQVSGISATEDTAPSSGRRAGAGGLAARPRPSLTRKSGTGPVYTRQQRSDIRRTSR